MKKLTSQAKSVFNSLVIVSLLSCSSHKPAPQSSRKESAPKVAQHTGTLNPVKIYEPYPGLRIHEFRMSNNGLRVFLLPRKQNETIAAAVAYSVGSRNEELGKTGLAHLFEHMMFRGTESYPEPFKTLSEWGGEFNAATSDDYTIYHEMAPSNKLDDLLKFESERMRKLLITPQVFNTERGAVVSERKMNYEDSPGGRLYWEAYKLAYDKHPYKTIPIGWQEDIERASFEDALSFYNHYYVPDRATLVLVGDLDIDTTVKDIENHFGAFAPANYPDRPTPTEPKHLANRTKIVKVKTETASVADAVMAHTFFDSHTMADIFFCVLFADGGTGYLSHALVDTGIARATSGICYPNHDPGLSIIHVTAVPGISAKVLEKKYLEARKGFLKWLTPERFENTKIYFETSQLESLRSPMDLAQTLAENSASSGDPLYTFEMVEKVKQLKLKDIEDSFRAWEKSPRNFVLIEAADKTDPMKKETAK